MSETFPFLSKEWLAAVKKIRDEAEKPAGASAHQMRMNMIVTESPFGDEDIQAHLDTTGGSVELGLTHIDTPDLTVTVDYVTAKAILVEQNPQVGMQAFMSGKIKVQGDMTKLMALQSSSPDPKAQIIAQKIKDVTSA